MASPCFTPGRDTPSTLDVERVAQRVVEVGAGSKVEMSDLAVIE
jgi:hypothetical protein